MLRISLDATALRALLVAHPTLEAELTTHAAHQVAEVFKRRIAQPLVADLIKGLVNNELSAKVPSAVNHQAESYMKYHAEKFLTAEVGKKIEAAVQTAIRLAVQQHTPAILENEIDRLTSAAIEKKLRALGVLS